VEREVSVRGERRAAKKKAAGDMKKASTYQEWREASDRYIDAQHIGRKGSR
jgi:hypothetical protein